MFNRRYRNHAKHTALFAKAESLPANHPDLNARGYGSAINKVLFSKISSAVLGWLIELVLRIMVLAVAIGILYFASLSGSDMITGIVLAAMVVTGIVYGVIEFPLPDWFDLP